eukprot:908967-Pyramimonas_sp.AAC.1
MGPGPGALLLVSLGFVRKRGLYLHPELMLSLVFVLNCIFIQNYAYTQTVELRCGIPRNFPKATSNKYFRSDDKGQLPKTHYDLF